MRKITTFRHAFQAYMEDHLNNKNRLDSEWAALCAYEAEPCSVSVARKVSSRRIETTRYGDATASRGSKNEQFILQHNAIEHFISDLIHMSNKYFKRTFKQQYRVKKVMLMILIKNRNINSFFFFNLYGKVERGLEQKIRLLSRVTDTSYYYKL